jgi:hypothetical protein
MTTLFLIICAISVAFFVVFFVRCSTPARRSTGAPAVRNSTATSTAGAATGRRFFAHAEQQMANYLSNHGPTAAVVLIALAITPVALRA